MAAETASGEEGFWRARREVETPDGGGASDSLHPGAAHRMYNFWSAPVAQMDRAIASGAIGREFESLRARQNSTETCKPGKRQLYSDRSAQEPCSSSRDGARWGWRSRLAAWRCWPPNTPRSSKRYGRMPRTTCRRACRFSLRYRSWVRVSLRRPSGAASAPGAKCVRNTARKWARRSLVVAHELADHFDTLAVQGETWTGAESWSSKAACGSGRSTLGNFSSKRAQRFQRSTASSFLGGWIFSAASKCRIASWNITVTACGGRPARIWALAWRSCSRPRQYCCS